MTSQQVLEVHDSALRKWADDLTEGERKVLAPNPMSRWAAWDIYLNWLRTFGWKMVGVLGYVGPIDKDRKVLIVVEGDGDPPSLDG
jgi:hypothetical protein